MADSEMDLSIPALSDGDNATESTPRTREVSVRDLI